MRPEKIWILDGDRPGDLAETEAEKTSKEEEEDRTRLHRGDALKNRLKERKLGEDVTVAGSAKIDLLLLAKETDQGNKTVWAGRMEEPKKVADQQGQGYEV